MGSLSSYALLFFHQVKARGRHITRTTLVLFLYLICSIVGRFGVAFLGFAFNLDETPLYTQPLLRPNWVNGTVNTNDAHGMALPSAITAVFGNSKG